jgi:hypothetical protein
MENRPAFHFFRHRSEIRVEDAPVPHTAPNIALRAYQLWDQAGRPEGRSDDFYFQAEEEFRQQLESEVAHEQKSNTPPRAND